LALRISQPAHVARDAEIQTVLDIFTIWKNSMHNSSVQSGFFNTIETIFYNTTILKRLTDWTVARLAA